MVGEGIQNTVLMATQAATYAVKITGGLNAAALVYSGLKDLSVAGETVSYTHLTLPTKA